MTISLDDFKQEIQCVYKNEIYSVRDNGAVLRHACEGKRIRSIDNQWTFGKPSTNTGYMEIASVRVHRIVAIAFHGKPPTNEHVVDHIDTNRRNNRPDNLRWLTKLENILKNPITLKKIIFHCGSIEAFLDDPSILGNHIDKDPNFEWMKTVTPTEAQISLSRLNNWAKKENDYTTNKYGLVGEWIFKSNRSISSIQEVSEFVVSLTPNAVQRNWKTPSEFPCCPKERADNPVNSYSENLKIGEFFSINKYSSSIIFDYSISEDHTTLWVLCKSGEEGALKPWSLAQVTFENNLFVHGNLGSFFEKTEAVKHFVLAQGLEWTGVNGNSIDDNC